MLLAGAISALELDRQIGRLQEAIEEPEKE